MKVDEYMAHDGVGLTKLVRSGSVSPEELFVCAGKIADAVNPSINAIVERFDQPLDYNRATDAPFAGVPFLIKDLALQAKDVLHEMGSRLCAGYRAPQDTELMTRFRHAGLATIGRASAPEFGYCVTTEPVANGPTRNPWNTDRMPGGSSGATAAAVAAGIVPLAHANDGGGSIRIPAACCGVMGLKPTRGRNPVGPNFGEQLNGWGAEFAVTRSVRDAATLLDAVNGPGIGDPYIIAPPARPYIDEINREPRPLRIAFATRPWSGVDMDPAIVTELERVAELCASLGHEVTDASPALDWDEFFAATITCWTANMVTWIDGAAELVGRQPDASNLEATTLACYRHGQSLHASELLAALDTMNRITRQIGEFFAHHEVFLTPVTSAGPLRLGELDANDATLDAVAWSAKTFAYAPFTPLFNMTGQPAVSLPLCHDANGLPVGAQFAGRFGREDTLLRLARQLEQASPWSLPAPLIA